MSMQQSPNTIRHTSLVIAAAVLCAASITGCNRSTTLPPLVDEQGGPQIPGKFVWHNLVTNDGAVITFHGRNLGGILDASKDGKPVKRGHWLSAMSVANLDASLAAVNEAGGKQLEAPIHVSGVGSVVTVEDADGAVLHLLSSSRGDPPDVEPRVHTWLWHELLANHADRALEFYEAAFGYRAEPLKKNPGSEYRVLWSSGEARAGVIQNPFAGTRSAWIPYVRVDDPTALAERAAELGGSVVIAPAPDVREGTLALVLDPSGAPVALQKWSPQDDEDEGEVSP
ncbi:MAG: VOC family protein [Deltaproteobacteria bacterium]|nr:VOC family protein [Deltaproteobacteria bacterium]